MRKINNLVKRLQQYNTAYRSGNPMISDAKYDTLIEELRSLDPNNKFLQSVEPETLDERKKIKHPYPMLSTQKAYSMNELSAWSNRVKTVAGEIGISGSRIMVKVMAKLDGIAARRSGKEFVTRGDGAYGRDISDAWNKGLKSLGLKGDQLGEIVIDKLFFESKMKEMAKHPRNIVAGLIGAKKLSDSAKFALDAGMVFFVPYKSLNNHMCQIDVMLRDFDKISKKILDLTAFDVDGIVIEVVNSEIKEHMGATDHHYRWQIAYKQNNQITSATVKDITWQTGRTGKITPVLDIEPVELSGATIKRVTAHNAGIVKSQSLGPGAIVKITRSGEVIPKIVETITKSNSVKIPNECPACGNEVSWQNDFLMCLNEDCDEKIIRSIIHWFKTLGNADNFGPVAVKKIIMSGVRTLSELYTLTGNDFAEIGFGPGQSANLEEALEDSIYKQIEDWRLLAAFGIPYLGTGDAKKILAKMTIKDVLEITEETLLSIDGFGQISAKAISEYIAENKEMISEMININFNLEKTMSNRPKSGALSGKTIVFTGKLSRPREELKKQAETLGANVIGSISKKVDYLVCGDKVGRSKSDKAVKLGIKMINENDFLNLCQPKKRFRRRDGR